MLAGWDLVGLGGEVVGSGFLVVNLPSLPLAAGSASRSMTVCSAPHSLLVYPVPLLLVRFLYRVFIQPSRNLRLLTRILNFPYLGRLWVPVLRWYLFVLDKHGFFLPYQWPSPVAHFLNTYPRT